VICLLVWVWFDTALALLLALISLFLPSHHFSLNVLLFVIIITLLIPLLLMLPMLSLHRLGELPLFCSFGTIVLLLIPLLFLHFSLAINHELLYLPLCISFMHVIASSAVTFWVVFISRRLRALMLFMLPGTLT
jgi:hypothetical protein